MKEKHELDAEGLNAFTNAPAGHRKEGNNDDGCRDELVLAGSLEEINRTSSNKKEPSNLIKTPNEHDVLLGRGKPVSI